MSDFTPVQIGLKDEAAYENIYTLYFGLANSADSFVVDVRKLLNDTELSNESIFQIIKKEKSDLVSYLKRGFVQGNNISIPGINMDKLIDSDLIDLPIEYEELITEWGEFHRLLDQIDKTKFVYPLSKLFFSEVGFFVLEEDFEKALNDFTTRFTTTEKQNQVVDIVDRFCNVLNDLLELGMLRKEGNMWMNVGNIMEMAVEHDIKKERPLSPNRRMFETYFTFDRFGTGKKKFVPDATDREEKIIA